MLGELHATYKDNSQFAALLWTHVTDESGTRTMHSSDTLTGGTEKEYCGNNAPMTRLSAD